MPTDRVDSQTFLTRLASCFESAVAAGERGTVWLTHKRLPPPQDEDEEMEAPNGESSSSREHDVLIRCTDGKRIKFSTTIPAASLPAFHATYASLLKAFFAPHMRKRDKKRERARAEVKARKRREVMEDVRDVVGSKGKDGQTRKWGKRQRQRLFRAQQKKEEARAKILAQEGAAAAKGQ